MREYDPDNPFTGKFDDEDAKLLGESAAANNTLRQSFLNSDRPAAATAFDRASLKRALFPIS